VRLADNSSAVEKDGVAIHNEFGTGLGVGRMKEINSVLRETQHTHTYKVG
jgi:hypothetical protein